MVEANVTRRRATLRGEGGTGTWIRGGTSGTKSMDDGTACAKNAVIDMNGIDLVCILIDWGFARARDQ